MYIFHLFIHWLEGNLCVRYDQIYHKTCLVIEMLPPKPKKTAENVDFRKVKNVYY